MKKRLITGIILGIVFVPLFIIQELNIPFIVVMGLLSCLATYELIHVSSSVVKYKPFTYVLSILGSLLVYASAFFCGSTMMIAPVINALLYLTPALIPLLVTLLIWLFKGINKSDVKRLLLAIYYPAIGFGVLSWLHIYAILISIYIIIVCMLTDVFAYVYGMLFGAHQLTPISPKKSVEGSVAGTIVSSFVGTWFACEVHHLVPSIDYISDNIFELFIEFDNKVVAIIAIAVFTILLSIVSQFGDLFASKIKRQYEVKDYSNLFPGHGGVMDRFDSTILSTIFLGTLLVIVAEIMIWLS